MSKVDGTKPEPIDLLEGAAAIAEYLFGDASQRRRVYHAAANTDLPIFKLGGVLCARPSTLLAWMAQQEEKASQRIRIS